MSLPAPAVNLDAVESFVVSHLLYGRCSFQDPNADQRVKVVVVPADGIDRAKDGFEPLFTAVAFLKQYCIFDCVSSGEIDGRIGCWSACKLEVDMMRPLAS